MNFITDANKASVDYIALYDPSHAKWKNYKNSTREYLHTINQYLKVEQIRPLLFAIARHFTPEETDKAFRYAVSISVRFLIYGGRGGFLDEHYAERAFQIGTGKITKASELRASLQNEVPTDTQFAQAFASARVSKSYLARYYLRALDKHKGGDPQPEFVANSDYEATNLEHIIPVKPGAGWYNVSAEDAASAQQLIGNLTFCLQRKTLPLATIALAIRWLSTSNQPTRSPMSLKNTASRSGLAEVKQRQNELAAIAPNTWPLTFA